MDIEQSRVAIDAEGEEQQIIEALVRAGEPEGFASVAHAIANLGI